MSDSEDKDSKTQDASEQKMRKARERGDTWSTREPGHVFAYLALLTIIVMVFPNFAPTAIGRFSAIFDTAGSIEIDSTEDLVAALGPLVRAASGFLLPALLVMVVGSICAVVLQGPLVVTLKRVKPKFSKLNPLSGFKRVFSASSLIEFAKNMVKLILIAALMGFVLYEAMEQLLPGSVMFPSAIANYLSGFAVQGLAWIMVLMVPILIFDLFTKRQQWLKKQKMTIKEQRDESKESEGDPMIKMRRQEIGRRRIRQQLRKSVPGATLVVVNPTHYAVALRYERGVDVAPVCVAKGTDLLALKIREIAFEADVPVIESPPLARALHKHSEIDMPIPEDHWAAAAELVGYVLDLKRRIRRKLPSGSAHLLPEAKVTR